MQDYKVFIRDYFKKNNIKFTQQRKAVLDCVFSFKKHFNIEELYIRLKEHNKRVSRASVYRTISLLVKAELIKETSGSGDRKFYEHIYGDIHHDHMICMRCGKVIEFFDEEIERFKEKISRKNNFFPLKHRFDIMGYCSRCQKVDKK